jgi:hypothetical protein
MNKILFIAIAFVSLSQIKAQDRVFTYTYQTNVLPLGVKELEYWNTVRFGKNDFYAAIDHRLELELGLGKNVQTAFYLNVSTESKYISAENEIIKSTATGFSNEWKIKLSDPVANKLGSGLYAEIGFNGSELELEMKFLFDKRIKNSLFALNLVGETELEFEVEEGGTEVNAESENKVELDFAYMQFVGKKKTNGLGLEVRNNNTFSEYEGWEYSTWFGGPSASFGGDRWFINLSVLPQWFNTKKAEGVTDHLELVDHTKMETRFLVSFAF